MEPESLSVIKIRNVVLATIPPSPRDDTVSNLQRRILTAIKQNDPDGVILDISAVQTMDSFFARTVAETVQMVNLMGSKTILVGMRPSVAITTTELGYTLGNVRTALTTDKALDILGG